jgi:hypothetical protein
MPAICMKYFSLYTGHKNVWDDFVTTGDSNLLINTIFILL